MYVFLARALWAWGFIDIDELDRSMAIINWFSSYLIPRKRS